MMVIRFRRDVFELVKKSIQNDKDTFLDECEKDIIVSMLNHFFDVSGYEDFFEKEIDLPTYEKYYQSTYKKHHSTLTEKFLENRIKEDMKNES